MEKKINYNVMITAGAILILVGFFRYLSVIENSVWENPIQLAQGLGFFLYGFGIFRKKRIEKNFVKTDTQT
jgi:hypothetical protein